MGRQVVFGVVLFWTLACQTAPQDVPATAPAPAPAPVPEPVVEVENRVTASFVEYSLGDMQHLILRHPTSGTEYNLVCVDKQCPQGPKLKPGTVLVVDYEYREVMGQGVDVVTNVSREGAPGPSNRVTANFVEFAVGDMQHLILRGTPSGTEYNFVCVDKQCDPAEQVTAGTPLAVDYEYREVMGQGVDVVTKVTVAGS